MLEYAVVRFLEDESGAETPTIEASEVPSSWLTNDLKQCWWPQTRDPARFISKSIPPVKNSKKWSLYDVKFEGFQESLVIAREKAAYLSGTSGDEADEIKVVTNAKKPKSKVLESVPEQSSDSDQEAPKIPNPPSLKISKKVTNKSMKVNLNVESGVGIDNFEDLLQVVSKSPSRSNEKSSTNKEFNQMPMPIYNSVKKPIQDMNKSSEKRKPTIVQDVTFSPQNSGRITVPRVLYAEPALPTDIGKDRSLKSISFPGEDDILMDIIGGNQYADQLAALTLMIKDCFSEISMTLAELNLSVRAISSRLTEVEIAININATTRNDSHQFADIAAAFPFTTQVDVMKFEADIRTNNDRQRIVTYLSRIGGNCAKECIRRVLAKVFSLSLANTSSWQGQLGNFKVSQLEIVSIIKDAVRVSYACTDKFYEDEGKEWFRQGTQKYKREQKKAGMNAAGNADVNV